MNNQIVTTERTVLRPSPLFPRYLVILAIVAGITAVLALFASNVRQTLASPAIAGGGSICGQKFNDLNGDGIWQIPGEPVLPNWVIQLEGAGTFITATTNVDGLYCFNGLVDGQYSVSEVQQPGWTQTFPNPSTGTGSHEVQIIQGQPVPPGPFNFGNHRDGGMSGIHGRKFYDENNNGDHDPGEPGLAGWTIQLEGAALVTTTVTGDGGYYWFTDLMTGTYTVTEVLQPGWVQTMPISPSHYVVSYVPPQPIENLDFGNYSPPGEIHGMKFHDQNGDGIKDASEPGLPNWQIGLNSNNTVWWTTTDAQGEYWFMDLPPGTYTVFEQMPLPTWVPPNMVQWVQTAPAAGTYTATISGQVVTGLDFGNWQNGKNDFCMIPWDNHFLNTVSLTTELYIFNASTDPQKGYSVQFVGPSSFTPPTATLTLNPYQYGVVPVSITYPAVFTAPYQNAQFQAIVTNLTSNTSFTCYAALWSFSPDWWTSPNVNSGLAGGIPFGFTQNISFTITNTMTLLNSNELTLGGDNTVDYRVWAMSRGMGMTGTIVSLNGMPPGSVISGSLTITPGQAANIPLTIEFVENIVLAPTDIILELYIDGDDEPDIVTSYLALLDPTRVYLPAILKP